MFLVSIVPDGFFFFFKEAVLKTLTEILYFKDVICNVLALLLSICV